MGMWRVGRGTEEQDTGQWVDSGGGGGEWKERSKFPKIKM